jgi:hypothetical protein
VGEEIGERHPTTVARHPVREAPSGAE